MFKQYFNFTFEVIAWKVESTIGTSSSLKQLMLVSDSTDAPLHFVDTQSFIVLDKEFGGIEQQF